MQITQLTGPATALRLAELPEPDATSMVLEGEPVLIDVHAAGVSFPELLQTRGAYQLRPELPFVPGCEVAGIVRLAPAASGLAPGDRVAGFCQTGGFAETAIAPLHLTFPLGDELTFPEGAALMLNAFTACFALHLRGRLTAGEWVLVHGAAGGIGTAALQVARGLGARTIAIVSSDEKEQVVRQTGADVVLRSDAAWKDEVRAITGVGVDLVLDPVGGQRFTDSIRCLAEGGRVVVVGFTAGTIPTMEVNRLPLANVDVVGAGWHSRADSSENREITRLLRGMVAGGVLRPVVGRRFPLEHAADALTVLEERRAVGKVVLETGRGR